MKTLMATNEPADLVEPLSQLAREFGEVEGASDIRSAISKAASAMKKKPPKPEDALEAINAAQETYDTEMQWRDAAEKAMGSTLYEYEEQMRSTIGIRQQENLNREQALEIAACSAHHRDISLQF